MSIHKSIQVVVGVLYAKNSSQILVSKRQQGKFMAGYWELPGGKIKDGESEKDCLTRELNEELGIEVVDARLFHKMSHDYENKTINLSIYTVEKYTGRALGAEGQNTQWCNLDDLNQYKLLPTMRIILNRICLPQYYWITPDESDTDLLLEKCECHLKTGTKIIQLRSKKAIASYHIEIIYQLCQSYDSKFILNVPNKTYMESCDGWHLTSNELMSINYRPCSQNKLLGASVHSIKEINQAEKILADYINLAPIMKTPSHPNAKTLGWEMAAHFVNKSNLPVYLLGGMTKDSLYKALQINAQGVAGISRI